MADNSAGLAMQKSSDIQRFYDLIALLEEKVGEKRRLGACSGKMTWPIRGVYFFFEDGETFNGKPRVTRVGTHAVNDGSKTTVWQRLSQHRGTKNPYGGNHRGSIFRLLVGEALLNSNPLLDVSTWGKNPPHLSEEDRKKEKQHEARVSDYLAQTKVLVLPIEDAASPNSLRAFVERNCIALLSNTTKRDATTPSAHWLGRSSGRPLVRESGLWNNNHVNESYNVEIFDVVARLISDIT